MMALPRVFEVPQGSRDPVFGHRPFAYGRRIMADSPCQEKYESTYGLINTAGAAGAVAAAGAQLSILWAKACTCGRACDHATDR
jgi:hypothetical protein